MGLEDKDSAEAWRCPKEQELRLREEELQEGNDLSRTGIEAVKDETLLEDKSHHNMATCEWTSLYEHKKQRKEIKKEASAAKTTV